MSLGTSICDQLHLPKRSLALVAKERLGFQLLHIQSSSFSKCRRGSYQVPVDPNAHLLFLIGKVSETISVIQ